MKNLTEYFERLWNNPPAPFNPEYKPYAAKVRRLTNESMENDNFYDNHTREECAEEWRKRYDMIMKHFENK